MNATPKMEQTIYAIQILVMRGMYYSELRAEIKRRDQNSEGIGSLLRSLSEFFCGAVLVQP